MHTKKILLIVFMALGLSVLAQKKYSHIALLNGIAHIGNGQVIEGSLVVIKDNKLESVMSTKGLKLNYRSYDTVIDISGKHVYPAIINCNNILGLHDAEAVRATVDFAEVGTLNPHIRALIAYNTDNLIVPTIKTNGILYTQVTPRGGLISGASSVMALEGWNWEDAVLKADDGIHINFPRMNTVRWSEEEGVSRSVNKKYQEELNQLESFFTDAVAYCNSGKVTETNLRLESMRQVLNGRANLYLHADKAKDLIAAINFARKFNIQKPVLVGAKDAAKITSLLKLYKVPVMYNRINDLPDNTDDDVDLIYKTPYLLQKDSVLFCFQLEGDMEAMQSRNLTFNAGAAVAYGLTKEEALAGLTYNAAKILGIDKQLGTLEEGKLASLVVSDGDILDMKSNNVILAFIAGKQVSLTNRQTELYLKYKSKYGIR